MAVENSLSWYRKLQSIRTRKIFCTEEFIHTWASQFNWVAIFPPCSLKTIPRRKKAIFLDKHFLKGVGGRTESYRAQNHVRYRTANITDSSQCIFSEKAPKRMPLPTHLLAQPPPLRPLGRRLALQGPQGFRSCVMFCGLSCLAFPIKLLSSHGKLNLIK